MKEYFVTFCIAFFVTIPACFFNYFQSLPISVLGGLLLAAVAYWRMAVVDRAGLSLSGHTVAYLLGLFMLPAPLYVLDFSNTVGSLMIILSYGLASLLACLLYRFRRRFAVSAVVAVAIWLLFVTTAVPAWSDYILSL